MPMADAHVLWQCAKTMADTINKTFTVTSDHDGRRLDAVLRDRLGEPWSRVRRYIDTGKVFLDEEPCCDQGQKVSAGQTLVLKPDAPRPAGRKAFSPEWIRHSDSHVIVVDKPPGISTVPLNRQDPSDIDSMEHRLRAYLQKQAPHGNKRRGALPSLLVVHRLDRRTSGLLVFARSMQARAELAEQFKAHTVHRRYLAIVHGHAPTKTIRSHLLEDRGDGIRGSSETSPHGGVRRAQKGKLAITHVTCVEKLRGASLVECRLETGRTNQIRIHMAEAGHPLVGETIYMRGYPGTIIEAPRLMLHAAELGFIHPITKEPLRFGSPLPAPMAELVASLSL